MVVVEQENRSNLGGQAFWSLGGLFFVDSPEQRRMGIRDSYELALQDWMGSAGFHREREDHWPRRWARAYVRFVAAEKRQYLTGPEVAGFGGGVHGYNALEGTFLGDVSSRAALRPRARGERNLSTFKPTSTLSGGGTVRKP